MNEKTFNQIVSLDIKGEATREQVEQLRSSPELWKMELVSRLQDIDKQLSERKAFSLAAQDWNIRRDYEEWKRGAVTARQAVLKRMHECKLLLKNENKKDYGVRDTLLAEIKDELVKIREILSK